MSFHEYSAAYRPPMPTCYVSLGLAGSEATSGPFEALLDTGSDVSVVPYATLQKLGSRPVSRGRARSLWGDSRRVDVHVVALSLDGLRFGALQVLADEQGEEIILGRFVLNRLKIVLDGPAGMVEIVG